LILSNHVLVPDRSSGLQPWRGLRAGSTLGAPHQERGHVLCLRRRARARAGLCPWRVRQLRRPVDPVARQRPGQRGSAVGAAARRRSAVGRRRPTALVCDDRGPDDRRPPRVRRWLAEPHAVFRDRTRAGRAVLHAILRAPRRRNLPRGRHARRPLRGAGALGAERRPGRYALVASAAMAVRGDRSHRDLAGYLEGPGHRRAPPHHQRQQHSSDHRSPVRGTVHRGQPAPATPARPQRHERPLPGPARPRRPAHTCRAGRRARAGAAAAQWRRAPRRQRSAELRRRGRGPGWRPHRPHHRRPGLVI
jgi:hypothetical protein